MNRLPFLPLLAVALLSNCHKDDAPIIQRPANAVAKVGDRWLTETDLDHYQHTGLSDRSLAFNRLIQEESLAQRAVQEGFDRQPEIQAAIRRLLSSRYLEANLSQTPTIEESQIRRIWESDARFARPKQAHLAILRQTIPSGDDGSQARAILAEALANYQESTPNARGFGPLAVQASDHQDTRYQGGDCGWVTEGQAHLFLPPEVIAQALTPTNPGLLNEIIVSGDAAWAIRVVALRPFSKVPLEQAAPRIRQELLAQAQKEQKASIFATAEQAVPIERLISPPPATALAEAAESAPTFP